MARIEIKNIGPIKEASFELNKVNVFMGPQSSGKSTIAKIISYCTWVEKRRMLDGFFRENFLGRLKSFHNLEDTYFPSDAYFFYEGDYCDIEFFSGHGNIIVRDNALFENRKQIYIPAERNFVSSIPNLGRYKETNNNIMDFLYYWYDAKKSYSQNAVLDIPELGVSFYHIEQEDRDAVVLDGGEEIILQSASSGIQSMLPLYLLVDYLTRLLYHKEIVPSPFERRYADELARDTLQLEYDTIEDDEGNEQEIEIGVLVEEIVNYKHSQIIIEEPEQNLFPSTQRDLIYYMLRVLNETKRNHRLTFTTHSPYILYALNNCMMGGLVYDKMSEQDRGKLKCRSSRIKPEDVSIYEIRDKKLVNIQQKDDGLIGANFFDQNMKKLMDDYYVMLNYYGK